MAWKRITGRPADPAGAEAAWLSGRFIGFLPASSAEPGTRAAAGWRFDRE
jgi:hypothetical protein